MSQSSSSVKVKVKNHNQIYSKEKKACKAKGKPFKDNALYTANIQHVFKREVCDDTDITWKRPNDICDTPCLVAKETAYDFISHPKFHADWFFTVCSCLVANRDLLNRVIPDQTNQEWNSENPDNYQGIFKFHFWWFGEWMEVVVDDTIPVIDDEPAFPHSATSNEFWPPLLLKAYAKLIREFGAVKTTHVIDALEDFVGCLPETVEMAETDLASKPEEQHQLFECMLTEIDRKSLLLAKRETVPPEYVPFSCTDTYPQTRLHKQRKITRTTNEENSSSGLLDGYYIISAMKTVCLEGTKLSDVFKTDQLAMIRLQDPLGKAKWMGPSGERSVDWSVISVEEKDKLGLTLTDNRDFWMTFEEFCQKFQETIICRLVDRDPAQTWHEAVIDGDFHDYGGRPGGQIAVNPQYVFDVTKTQEEVMVQVMAKRDDYYPTSYGLAVYKVEVNREYRFLVKKLQEKITRIKKASIRAHLVRVGPLTEGRYAIIPFADSRRPFVLRVLTPYPIHLRKLKDKATKVSPLGHFGETTLRVISGEDFYIPHKESTVHCVVSCGLHKVKIPGCPANTRILEWNNGVLFDPSHWFSGKSIKIQVWNDNVQIGEVECPLSRHSKDSPDELELEAKSGGGKLRVSRGFHHNDHHAYSPVDW